MRLTVLLVDFWRPERPRETWGVDVRALSFAREGREIRGLLLLKAPVYRFEIDDNRRRFLLSALWMRPRSFLLPTFASRCAEPYGLYLGSQANRQHGRPSATTADQASGGEPCTEPNLPPSSSSGSRSSTSSGGCASSRQDGQGDGAPCAALSPAMQAVVDHHVAFRIAAALAANENQVDSTDRRAP